MKQSANTTSPLFLGGWILFVTFGIVYTLFFSLAPNKDVFATPIKNTQLQKNTSWSADDAIVRFQIEQNQISEKSWETNNTWLVVVESDAPLSVLPRTPKHIVSTQELFFGKKQTVPSQTSVKTNAIDSLLWSEYPWMLSFPWTHHWRGTMKSASFVWFASSIKYVLKNNDNTHFAYLWNDLPDISDAVAKHAWKTVAFIDKKDINTHWLFGDKVIFLQIPQYLGKKQLFFVYFSEERDRWFIQVDDDIFETTKPLLRELFAKRYNR